MEYSYKLGHICLGIEEIMTYINKYIKRPIIKIIKIFKYIPILWKDEDWDSHYLLDLIDYKLKRMHNCLDKNNIVARKELEKMLSTINETREYIYNCKNFDNVFKDKIEKPPVNISFRFEKLETGCSRLISVNMDTGKDFTEEENNVYNSWLVRMHQYQDQEWNKIWDTIKKHGKSWWD